jgi:hypothetical protein
MVREIYFKYSVGRFTTVKGSEVPFSLKAVLYGAGGVQIPSPGIATPKFCFSVSGVTGAGNVLMYAILTQLQWKLEQPKSFPGKSVVVAANAAKCALQVPERKLVLR